MLLLLVTCIIVNRAQYDHVYNIYFPLNSSKTLIILSTIIVATSIAGPYFLNSYQSNIFQILFLIIVFLTVGAIVIFSKQINHDYFPFFIYCLSFGLLIHSTLISSYLRGADVHLEYALLQSIIRDGYWQIDINYHNLSSVLSITTLAPIYSILLNIDGIWLFKLIYPILFSFVPLILYVGYYEYIGKLAAFLSSFLFCSFSIFYTEITALARQEVAEIFFALLILIILDKSLIRPIKMSLYIIFSIGLIFSHYGLSYIYIIMVALAIVNIYVINYLVVDVVPRFRKNKRLHVNMGGVINISTLLIFVAASTLWYTSVSNSGTFTGVITIANEIKNVIFDEFLLQSGNNEYVSMALGTSNYLSVNYFFAAILFDVIQVFIIIGLLTIVWGIFSKKDCLFKNNIQYVAFAIGSLLLLLFAIAVPTFANKLNLTRIYHVLLFTLSPFAIIGGTYILDLLYKYILKRDSFNVCVGFVASIVLVFFLFQSGIVFELTNDKPLIYTVSYNDYAFEFLYDQDFNALIWMDKASVNKQKIYGDFGFISYYIPGFDQKYQDFTIGDYLSESTPIEDKNRFLYIRKGNEISQKVCIIKYKYSNVGLDKITSNNPLNTIFTSGSSKIFQITNL